MIVRRVLRICVLPLVITMVVLHGQKLLVSAEQPSAVDRTGPPHGSPELSLTMAAARPGGTRSAQGHGNDDCEDRIEIFDGVTPIDTLAATTDGLPTNGLGDCAAFGDPQLHNDIWFNWTATCNGELTVSTCDTVDYDSKIAIYDDCDVGLCPRGGDEIGCNDDGPDPPCSGFSSIATAEVLQGSCYKMRIGGFRADDRGTGTVEISSFCPDTCGDGICDPGDDECNCPADCPGECACFVFDNKSEFEAFNEEEGKALKGIEDFEETPPGTPIIDVDDPLCGGIPSTPLPPLFPNGIDQLNLCVQANTLAGAPVDPSPHGPPNGLVFVEFGAGFGESSDIVVAGYFVDSFDLMFGDPVPPDQQDNHTGVGFDVVSIFGGGTVAIRVFDKNNVEIVSATSPAEAGGFNFWGVWCESTIGRINIFDPGNGVEGGDNIQMWVEGDPCGECPTDVDGSGDTEAFDLAILLGAWGPVTPDSACLDADENGFIEAFDLAGLLGAWGPCP